MTTPTSQEKMEIADALEEKLDELKDLMREVRGLVQEVGGITNERAEVYWLAHIRTALDNDHDYLGGSMTTMADTIEEIRENADESEDDDDDE